MKYFLILCIAFCTSSIVHGQRRSANMKSCMETGDLVRMVVLAKVKYEEAVSLNQKAKKLKQKYYSLVKGFKDSAKTEGYIVCLKRMIYEDSLKPDPKMTDFSYKDPISSVITKCQSMTNYELLNTMLWNLELKNTDSTLICFPDRIDWHLRSRLVDSSGRKTK